MILYLTKGNGVHVSPSACEVVSKVFRKAGGSWKRIFLGSTADLKLLRRVIKVAIKAKVLPKEEKWP